MAQQMLAGQVLYRDLLEVNPPLVVWLNLPVVWLAQQLGMSAYYLYYGTVTVGLSICAALTIRWRLVPARWWVLLAIVLGPLAGADLGQRDHLCLGLMLPSVALTLNAIAEDGAPVSWPMAVFVGGLAGIALALKPFLAPVWLLLVWRRGVRVPDAATVAVGVLYLGAVLYFAPDYLPLLRVLAETYQDFNRQSWLDMVVHGVGATLLVMALGWAYLRRSGVRSEAASLCLLAAAGAWLGAVLQRKGWGYHWYPSTGLLVIAAALIWRASNAVAEASAGAAHVRRVARYLVAAAMILATGRIIVTAQALLERRSMVELVDDVTDDGDSVVVLSSRVSDGWPAVPLAGTAWAARLPSLWFAQAYGVRGLAAMNAGERLLYDALIQDLRAEPRVLIIETPQLNGRRIHRAGFDVVEYLRQSPQGSQVLSRYQPTRERDGMAIWVHR